MPSLSEAIAIEGSALVGALVYTFSDTFWFSAVEGEVYAYSSAFTAVVFWLILKWEDHADEPHSDRWLVLIFYMTGLSIGVHLLNLLCLPAIVLVFGYVRLYNSSSILPLTASTRGTDFLLACGYVTLALPYMYRSIETGLRSIDVRTLTEAAESLGAGPLTTLRRVILPNIRSAVLSGAFLTFAIVIGEFTFASLLNRPAFGPYLQLVGANRAYEPAALAIVAFAVTWACMGIIQVISRNRTAAIK